jgi:L-ascorbate metabolism protein UlaG (beta-lactamase superfamily)
MKLSELKKALDTLDAQPPAFHPNEQRDEAFLCIGRFLETATREGARFDLAQKPNAVWELIEARLLKALDEIEAPSFAQNGGVLWQMYNSGVIIRCAEIVMAFDVIPMPRKFGWSEPPGLTERIARDIDFLLVTHDHTDHYDGQLVRECLRLGKPVCMPASLAGEWESDVNLHAVDDGWTLDVSDTGIIGRRGCHVWREAMDEVPLVYYEVICPSGHRLIFGGDVDYTKSFEKTPGVAIDLLFLPWRAPNEAYEEGHEKQQGTPLDAARAALDRVGPRVLLYEHCGELEHVYDGFPSSYDIALHLKKSLDTPSELLFWGEHIALS